MIGIELNSECHSVYVPNPAHRTGGGVFCFLGAFSEQIVLSVLAVTQGAMNFSSVPKALLTTFGFMMGQFQLSYFFQVGPEVGIPAAILFMIYQVLINVTLLNLLVAIMIEAYSKVSYLRNPFPQ